MEMVFFNPFAGTHSYCDVTAEMMADFHLPLRFPFFVNSMTEEVHKPTFDFLRKEGLRESFERNRRWHPSKVENRAYALRQWNDFLGYMQLTWDNATPTAFRMFADNMLSRVHEHTGDMLSSDYMYNVAKYIADSYGFARSRGLSTVDLNEAEVLDALKDDDLDVPPNRDGFGARTVRRLSKRAFTEDQWTLIAGQLGELHSDDNPWSFEMPSMCPRLTCESALQMGPRVSEVLITREAVMSIPWDGDTTGHVPLTLYGTKGNKVRNVALPKLLLASYRHYDATERASVLRMARERVGEAFVEPNEFFLHGPSAGRWAGRPLSKQSLQRFFRDACVAAGLVHKLSVTLPNGEVIQVEVPKFTFHSLRHSFAIWMYFTRKFILGIDQEPWEYISARLGHADIRVTLSTYLDVSRFLEPEISGLLRRHFHAACDWDVEAHG